MDQQTWVTLIGLAGVALSMLAYLSTMKRDLRAEISGVRTELKGDIADLRAEISGVRTELKGDIADLRTELKGDIAELRTELKGDIAELRTELKGDIAQHREETRAGFAMVDARLIALEGRTYDLAAGRTTS